MTRTPRRVRVWALVDPRGRVVFCALSQRGCYEHLYYWRSPANASWHYALRACRRAGWRVRRLAPEEVEP